MSVTISSDTFGKEIWCGNSALCVSQGAVEVFRVGARGRTYLLSLLDRIGASHTPVELLWCTYLHVYWKRLLILYLLKRVL